MQAINLLQDNIRLLESLIIFGSDVSSVCGAPAGSPEQLFLLCLQRLKAGDVPGAEAALSDLAGALHVSSDSAALEPLRTIAKIKAFPTDKQKLRDFLIKELRLQFEEQGDCDDQQSAAQGGPSPAAAAAGASASGTPARASHISPDQYSTAAFQAKLDSAQHKPRGESALIRTLDPSTLLSAVIDGALPLQATWQLLQEDSIPPAALPVACLAKVLSDRHAEWASSTSTRWSGSDWRASPVVQWVTSRWDDLTTEQAAAVRPVLPGPAYGANPDLDRPYAAARIKKAMAGDAAAGAAATGREVPLPWQAGADAAASRASLERVLKECDALGPPADWIRAHALYAQLQLQRQQQPAVDVDLLNSFMQLLRRCTWSIGGAFGTGEQHQQQQQQQQHPLHVCCVSCGMRPILGPRFRSQGNYAVNLCSNCVGLPSAAAGAPYEEVNGDDSIYMLPARELPHVLRGLPDSLAAVEQELRKLAADVLFEAAVASDGSCADTAGLELPASTWSALVTAEAHLLSGRGDAASKWARRYQLNGGNVNALRNSEELAFADDSRSTYDVGEDVVLDLYTKNVGTEAVLLKVYELNCWKLYTATQAEADLNLELAGVAPTRTITLQAPADPMIRRRHRVPLGLSGVPGVWLVEVVAGSRRLRARISKGGLRLWQRPSVAGQVLQVMDEAWRPVQGVRVWCDGKEYTGGTGAGSSEVLLPYARQEDSTALVVAAGLSSSLAGGGKEAVVLVEGFRRLQEQYSLGAQLFCHQELLLPGHTVQLKLVLSLQLHGIPAPVQLLQELQLSLTAHTPEGGPVTQAIQDLSLDEATCTVLVTYSLPQHSTRLSAELTARILLTLPGTNGEPAYQDFHLQSLLPGQHGLQHSVDIEGSRQSSNIWDVYLCPAAFPASAAPAAPGYALQVLGRCGESPTAPKALSVWLDHVNFSPEHQLHLKVQTGPGGVVNLGHLQGIRHIQAQIEAGVDCVDQHGLAAAGAAARDAGGSRHEGAAHQHAGPVRSWRIARPSWWLGGLQEEYVVAEGSTLELPVTPAAGQAVQATLLQLVSPPLAAGSACKSAAHAAAVAADISAAHLELQHCTPTQDIHNSDTAAAAAGPDNRSSLFGSDAAVTIRVKGLAAGLYRLLLPGLLLKSPNSGTVGADWNEGPLHASNMAVHIHVLPATSASCSSTDGMARGSPAAVSSANAAAGADDDAREPTSINQPEWLYAGPGCTQISPQVPALLQASSQQQLHLTSLTCSVSSGVSLQVTGSQQLLQAAQLLLVFSRFLPDSTASAAELVPPQLPWATPHSSIEAFGFNPGLATQRQMWGLGSNPEGLGYGPCPQACGGQAACSYSQDARLDSAVAYVLQRRQWEAAGGGRRPGMLLERPSLLVCPHAVRSAAAATTVLKGGNGARLMKKPMAGMQFQPHAAACPMPRHGTVAHGGFSLGGAAVGTECGLYGAAAPMGATLQRQAAHASSPVLGFLAQPAAVLTQLQLDEDGRLQLTAEELQQLLSQAAGRPAAATTQASEAQLSQAAADVWAATGYRVVCAAVYDPQAPGQFGAALCAVQGALGAVGDSGPQASREQVAAAGADQPAGSSSSGVSDGDGCCLPAAAVKDLGLNRPVDPAVVSALSCEVVVMQQAGQSLSIDNPDAAEAGVMGSIQQLYHLLMALVKAAESGGSAALPYSTGAGSGSGCRQLAGLPRLCVPTGTQEAVSVLLRQWEPLVLQWPQLGASARHDLISRLASCELLFFMALKDKATYEEVLLPLVRYKLPSELSCLEDILLLQANHGQLPIPTVCSNIQQQPAQEVSAGDAGYQAEKQQLLEHWCAPHRYMLLNHLERLLLAALEGKQALLQFSANLMHQLQSPAEKRGVKRSWMARDRRTVFEFALLLARSLEQQQQQQQQQDAHGNADADGGPDSGTPKTAAGADNDSDDGFVKVDRPADRATGGGVRLEQPHCEVFDWEDDAVMPMAAPCAAAAPQAMAARPRMSAARHAQDLSARAQVASAAGSAANAVRVPKETKEWAEVCWWKSETQRPQLIPAARFWAEYARHLATSPAGSSFIPSDPTDVAASTAAVIAALAVTGLPWEGGPAASSSASSSTSTTSSSRVRASSIGCSRDHEGATLTLTAKQPCLLWVKVMKPLAMISSAAAEAAAEAPTSATGGESSAAAAAAAGAAGTDAVEANSVLVVDRLYDPRFAASTDPETGEEVLLALTPSQQQPLLTGQRYCRSVVLTSTVAAERHLQLLVQLPQGALSLDGALGTISRDIKLPPYASMQVQQTFYFPKAGVFQQAPVSAVTIMGRPSWLPQAPPSLLHVVDPASCVSEGERSPGLQASSAHLDPAAQWRQCVSSRDKQQLLEYLQKGDLTGAKLSDASKFCKDPAFFSAAVAALSRRRVFAPAIWKWAVVHGDAAALKQYLPTTALIQRLQRNYSVPVCRLLDSVFGTGSTTAGSRRAEGRELCGLELRHVEFWPWVNPYCRPITHSGADANLPSVLRDNLAVAQQWKSFLLSLVLDCSSSSSNSSGPQADHPHDAGSGTDGHGSSKTSGVGRLAPDQVTAAAMHLLLQDRIDEAEEVLAAHGCLDMTGGGVDGSREVQLATGPFSMQRDYLTAWLALCRPLAAAETQAAVTARAVSVGKAVVSKYKGCTAGAWAKRMKQLETLISQLQQQDGSPMQPEAAAAAGTALKAGTDALLTVVGLEGTTLRLQVAGVQQLQLAAYQIDTELLFTTQPFSSFSSSSSSSSGVAGATCAPVRLDRGSITAPAADDGLGRVSFVQPTAKVQLQLLSGSPDAASDPAEHPIDTAAVSGATRVRCTPVVVERASGGSGTSSSSSVCECVLDLDALLPDMKHLSVLLEVTAGGLSAALPRFASALTVHVLEGQGVLQAYLQPSAAATCNGMRPAAATYVKVFARDRSGDEFFYKDGYTDLRGRFDYVTLTSTADMSRVVRYSLLVASREHGAVMLQAAPPPK